MAFVYFPAEQAIKEHDNIIAISGGAAGILKPELLESALIFIQDDAYYPVMEDKLTHLVYSVAMNHCFMDGNKRSSIALGAYFLEINSLGNIVPAFIVEMENVVLWVARGIIPKEMLREIVASLIANGELNEDLKLRLTEALTDVELVVEDDD